MFVSSAISRADIGPDSSSACLISRQLLKLFPFFCLFIEVKIDDPGECVTVKQVGTLRGVDLYATQIGMAQAEQISGFHLLNGSI